MVEPSPPLPRLAFSLRPNQFDHRPQPPTTRTASALTQYTATPHLQPGAAHGRAQSATPMAAAPSASPEPPTLVTSASLVELGPEEKHAATGSSTTEVVEEPYTIYSNRERWALVSVVAVAGLFS